LPAARRVTNSSSPDGHGAVVAWSGFFHSGLPSALRNAKVQPAVVDA